MTSQTSEPPSLVFYNVRRKIAVNVITPIKLHFLPRIGESVFLPGATEGAQVYRVVNVTYYFAHSKPLTYGLFEAYRILEGKPAGADDADVKGEQVPQMENSPSRIQIDVEPV